MIKWKSLLNKSLLKEYTFECINCEKQFTIIPITFLKYLENSKKFYCLECIINHKKQDDFCRYCGEKYDN